ncbi:hypothetical protein ACFQS1_30550 [Paractinoplanes rhizophilus]|jgi:hypothetical protein|uniref:Uncharacterized protein n=1 Tax=Paractinoplanes rhizophilus TaxID=1416877 RepID=A0ABW2I199_9ACTN|nr:hypothetical protein [Actinoplanes sp.]
MLIDPFRLAEAGTAAAAVLGVALLPAAWHALDPALATVLAAAWMMLTSGVYALHAVTFDCFRLTGQHRRRIFSFTRSEE